MNCLEFKRLALSDPNSKEENFVVHSKECPDCLKYIGSIRKMDADLDRSLNVTVPSDLMARLQLNQEMMEETVEPSKNYFGKKYAMAASFAAALFVAGLFMSNQFGINNQIDEDYKTMLSALVEHMGENEFTPVWGAERANKTVNTLLASYDGQLQFKKLDNLQFGRICPMGKYRGLHANMQTDNGQVTFAYIKGDSVGDLLDTGYEGFISRVKPVRGGNLVIMSRNSKSLEQADRELEEAMYWDI